MLFSCLALPVFSLVKVVAGGAPTEQYRFSHGDELAIIVEILVEYNISV